MKISQIKINHGFRKDLGDLDGLTQSIKEIGLLHPIVIDEDGNLIAGLRRLNACIKLGWTDIPVNRVNLKDIIKGQVDKNIVRKDFTPSEAVAIWQAMEKYSKWHQPSDSDGNEIRRERASKLIGLGVDSLSKAKQVVDSGDRSLIEEMDRTGNIFSAYRKLKQEAEKVLPLPPGKYDVIYADPPWRYDFDVESRATEKHYPTLTIDEICSYKDRNGKPIQDVFADDAVLFLWATSPKLLETPKVIGS